MPIFCLIDATLKSTCDANTRNLEQADIRLRDIAMPHEINYTIDYISGREFKNIDASRIGHLLASSIETNPFFCQKIIDSAQKHLFDAADFDAVLVYDKTTKELVGFIPFKRHNPGSLFPKTVNNTHLHLYQMHGVPLIDSARPREVIDAFLKLTAAETTAARRWIFPHVPVDGPFAALLAECAADSGYETRCIKLYDRPVLVRDPGGFAAHVDRVIGKKRKKDLDRNFRRLNEAGTVAFERATDPDLVASRLEDFLRLEAKGWKGRKGTAFLSRHSDARFARAAFSGGGDGVEISIDSLLLNDAAVACSLNLKIGETIFTPKCTYDEDLRKYSPGLLLEYLVIEEFYRDREVRYMDSAVTINDHVISNFWNETQVMGTLILGPRGPLTRTLATLETFTHEARETAKRLVATATNRLQLLSEMRLTK